MTKLLFYLIKMLTSGLSQAIILPYETSLHKQQIGLFGQTGICNCSFEYATAAQSNAPTRESASTLPLAILLVGFVGLNTILTKDGVFLISGSQPDLLVGSTTPKNIGKYCTIKSN